MDVNNITESQELQRLYEKSMGSKQNHPEGARPEGLFGGRDSLRMSEMSSIFSETMKVSEEETKDLMEFGKSIADSIGNGTFDVNSLLENAPDIVTKIADEKGINLENALNEIASHAEEIRAKMPPPPVNSGSGSSDDSESDSSEGDSSENYFNDENGNGIDDDEEIEGAE